MNGITSIILFSLIGISSALQYCTLCHNGEDIPEEFEDLILDNEGDTCKKYETIATWLDATDEKCASYYQLIGFTRCGCERPNVTPRPEKVCNLCKNGGSPSQNSVIDLTQLGQWDAGNIECNEAQTYLDNFSMSPSSCAKFQSVGFKDCGCTPPASPTPPPRSPTDSPSSKPSYAFQNTDCEVMKKGIFPMVDSDFRGSANFKYGIGLNLVDGITFEDVASPLQDVMDIIVSLAANKGCSGSRRRLEVRRFLGDDDVFVHYVDFENLEDIGNGLAEGNAEVFYSTFPSTTRGRKLVNVDSLSGVVTDIIEENSAEIAAGVDGVEGVYTGDNLPPQGNSQDGNGIAIGLGVSSVVVVLAAGLLLSRKKGIKKDLPDDIGRVILLSSSQMRSEEGLVPHGEAKFTERGVEFYPEDFSLGSEDALSTKRRDLAFVTANAVELEAAPKYGINDAFPIELTSGRDLYQDSDSSDDDYPRDEEKEHRPIAVRTKPSYRVENTMDL